MLTKDEFESAVDTHVIATMDLARRGHSELALRMFGQIIEICWDLTRPGVEMMQHDISGHIPDKHRTWLASLRIMLVVDEDGAAMMGWGEGRDRDGNNVIKSQGITEDDHAEIMAIIDEQMEVHFGHIDQSKVSRFDESINKASLVTTTHVNVTKDDIDAQVAAFSGELDRLESLWGGGDSDD